MIASGEVPASLVYEDEKAVAFLDLNPRARGHTLVIPKRHAATFTDLSEEEGGKLFAAVRTVAARLMQELGAAGVNIGVNSGEVAGQVVPHVHVHVVPMSSMRQLDLASWDTSPDPDALAQAAEEIRAALRKLGHAEVSD